MTSVHTKFQKQLEQHHELPWACLNSLTRFKGEKSKPRGVNYRSIEQSNEPHRRSSPWCTEAHRRGRSARQANLTRGPRKRHLPINIYKNRSPGYERKLIFHIAVGKLNLLLISYSTSIWYSIYFLSNQKTPSLFTFCCMSDAVAKKGQSELSLLGDNDKLLILLQ